MFKDTLFFASIFIVGFAILTLFLPIEMYDGYVLLDSGEILPEKMSLSYLIDKPSFIAEYVDFNVDDIKLYNSGWILVGIINIGLPMLLGFRMAIARKKKQNAK